MGPLPARTLLAALAAALVAALLPLAAVACNSPYNVCINAERHCEYCSFDQQKCDPIVCSWQGTKCNTKSVQRYDVSVCNIFDCNCDPCNACGPTHLSGGNPSCGSDYQPCKDVGGCDQKCKTNYPSYYLDGNCVACGPGGTRATANESCSDRAQFVAMPLAEKTARLSQSVCKYANTTAGEPLLTAILAAADVNQDGVLSCNEYNLLKWTALPLNSSEAAALAAAKVKTRKVNLPKPTCKTSTNGKKRLSFLLAILRRPTRPVNF